MRRRLRLPEPVGELADEIYAQSMLDPDAGETSRDIEPDEQQKRELLSALMGARPDGDPEAWDAPRDALRRDLDY